MNARRGKSPIEVHGMESTHAAAARLTLEEARAIQDGFRERLRLQTDAHERIEASKDLHRHVGTAYFNPCPVCDWNWS